MMVTSSLQRIAWLLTICNEHSTLPGLGQFLLYHVIPWLLALPTSHTTCSFSSPVINSTMNRTAKENRAVVQEGEFQCKCEDWSQCLQSVCQILIPQLPSLDLNSSSLNNNKFNNNTSIPMIKQHWEELIKRVVEIGGRGCENAMMVINEIVNISGMNAK